ncbi:unnamed protein product, partial [Musa banksii]
SNTRKNGRIDPIHLQSNKEKKGSQILPLDVDWCFAVVWHPQHQQVPAANTDQAWQLPWRPEWPQEAVFIGGFLGAAFLAGQGWQSWPFGEGDKVWEQPLPRMHYWCELGSTDASNLCSDMRIRSCHYSLLRKMNKSERLCFPDQT